MRTIRYREIADELRREIRDGRYAPGRLLPSEAELSAAFEASRVTIRKSLEALRAEGLVDSRQGFGWFVAGDPLRQSLVRLGTIDAQLAASGRAAGRKVLEFGFVPAAGRVRAVLGAGSVLRVLRLSLADGAPFARVTIWCPERLAADISRAAAERTSFQELLGVELNGATQTIGAALASPDDAAALDVPAASPVLVCERITWAADRSPALLSQHVFPGHLTEFVVELQGPQHSMNPSGLRLVEERAGAAQDPSGPAAEA
ncbi:MAG: GntR family transcriptional regulator [Acidimicrobiales bacterium]